MINIIVKNAESFIPSVRVKEYSPNGIYNKMVLVSENTLSECSSNVMDGKIFYSDPICGCYYERII